ncbi:MAG TPA: methylated-DNA--[protein]-cysteine S-methyltransferase [Caulobacteraceae bacterium]|jgi:methylated-DNA-[protein]-cysteine S-methyltransferase
MSEPGFALFETSVGRCGVVWRGAKLAGVHLPGSGDAPASLRRRFPDAVEAAPPPAVAAAIEAITALLEGEPRGLADLPLDTSAVPDFERRVYEVARTIPPGAVLTYGEVAARMGEPGAAQAVGRALGRNPFPIVVPCHRVVAADGKLGGFSAPGGRSTKLKLLAIERARRRSDEPDLFDADARLTRKDSPRPSGDGYKRGHKPPGGVR